jgi:LysR family transcriptional regulator, nod-box dependent transcriptional activator
MQSYDQFMRSEKLFTDEFVVAISKDNAFTTKTITFDELCEMGYIETRWGGVIVGVTEQLGASSLSSHTRARGCQTSSLL